MCNHGADFTAAPLKTFQYSQAAQPDDTRGTGF